MTSCLFVNFKQLNVPWDEKNMEKKFWFTWFFKKLFSKRLKMHVTENKLGLQLKTLWNMVVEELMFH